MHFFFYGTLTHHHANALTRDMMPCLGAGRSASVRAALYAVGTPDGYYPALVAGEGRVHGWLYSTAPGFDAAMLARLDAYENYLPRRPRSSEYLRRRLPVRLSGGGTLLAHAYCWNRSVDAAMIPLPDGDFGGWLRAHHLRAWGTPA